MIIFKNKHTTVFQSSIFQMNSTVITTNDLILVVDPGYLPQEVDDIRNYVNRIKENRSIYLFFTHSDFDHIVGAGAFPEAKTIASRKFTVSAMKKKQLEDIKRFDDDLYINRPYRIDYPNIDFIIEGSGEQLIIGDTVITFYDAFGHTDDGLMAVVEPVKLLISGDYLSDIEFPFIYHSYQEYEKTLNTFKTALLQQGSLVLIPGHGNVADELDEIKKRIEDAEEYIKLVQREHDEEEFGLFLIEKNYHFETNLIKRHKENIAIWKEQVK